MLDASVSLAWCFVYESVDSTRALVDTVIRDGAVVPPIWAFEVRNGVLAGCRRGRLSQDQASQFIDFVSDLQIELDDISIVQTFVDVIATAANHGLATYDASYLELAMRRQLPLATLDKRLVQAARQTGIELALEAI